MNTDWPLTPLGEVLTERRETPDASALATGEIPIVAKVGFNDGQIHLRVGGDTKTGMILIRPGDIVVSGINAAKGAIALYEKEKTRPIAATIHYGAYIPDTSRVDVFYLWWLLRSGTFRDLLQEYVPGGIKTELKAKRFLPIPVPLPPLSEQRRIVARIDELAAKIEEAKGLRREAVEAVEAFTLSLHIDLSASRKVSMADIMRLHEDKAEVRVGEIYPQVGVKGFGQGLFARETLASTDTTYKAFNRLYAGSVVLSQVKGWEGAIAVCPIELEGRFVSPEYRTFQCIAGNADPKYLSTIIKMPWFWNRLKNATHGVGGRRERTRPEQFLKIEVPMPTYEKQVQATRLFCQTDALKALQAETAAELAALLPSVLDRAFSGRL